MIPKTVLINACSQVPLIHLHVYRLIDMREGRHFLFPAWRFSFHFPMKKCYHEKKLYHNLYSFVQSVLFPIHYSIRHSDWSKYVYLFENYKHRVSILDSNIMTLLEITDPKQTNQWFFFSENENANCIVVCLFANRQVGGKFRRQLIAAQS